MTSPSRGALWLARASAWACAAFGLSVGAHVVGGGALPSAGGAALLVAALLWVGLLLTRRRLGPVAVTATLGVSQLAMHSVLTLTETQGCGSVTGHTGHEVAVACTGETAAVAHTHHSSLTMLAAHAAAALLLGLLLAKGEAAVWFLAGLVRPHLPAAVALPSPTRRALAPSRADEATPTTVPVLGGVGRRGPPARRAPAVA